MLTVVHGKEFVCAVACSVSVGFGDDAMLIGLEQDWECAPNSEGILTAYSGSFPIRTTSSREMTRMGVSAIFSHAASTEGDGLSL